MKKALFNPLPYDFSFEWLDDSNIAHTLTIPHEDLSYFEEPQYTFMTRHLSDQIYNERGQKTNHEDDIKEIITEIQIEV